jgi:cell division protein FtsI/penicillin-binding protein 2
MAAAEGSARLTLEAERGDILDRNGVPLADSIRGKMVIADPVLTAGEAPDLARLLSDRLSIDYFKTLDALRGRKTGSRYEYVARRVPSTLAGDTLAELEKAGFEGISLEEDPIRDYPAGDVAANILGYMGTDEPLGGFERTFDKQLAGMRQQVTQAQAKPAAYQKAKGITYADEPVDQDSSRLAELDTGCAAARSAEQEAGIRDQPRPGEGAGGTPDAQAARFVKKSSLAA